MVLNKGKFPILGCQLAIALVSVLLAIVSVASDYFGWSSGPGSSCMPVGGIEIYFNFALLLLGAPSLVLGIFGFAVYIEDSTKKFLFSLFLTLIPLSLVATILHNSWGSIRS